MDERILVISPFLTMYSVLRKSNDTDPSTGFKFFISWLLCGSVQKRAFFSSLRFMKENFIITKENLDNKEICSDNIAWITMRDGFFFFY